MLEACGVSVVSHQCDSVFLGIYYRSMEGQGAATTDCSGASSKFPAVKIERRSDNLLSSGKCAYLASK